MSVVRLVRLAAAALVVAAVARPASAQALFEGQITMTLKSARGSVPTELYIKDGVTRMDASGPGGNSMVIVNDPAKKEMMMIMPERQMYFKRSTDMASMPQMDGAPPAAPKPTITKTGKMETIAGMSCEHHTITHENGDAEDACIASGIGTFAPAAGGMGRGMGGGRMGGAGGGGGGGVGGGGGGGGGAGGGAGGPPRQDMGWARDLGKGMFPLKVSKNGETVLEVTKIEKKKLDPTLFQAPEGFQDMSAMMGGGGRPGRPPVE